MPAQQRSPENKFAYVVVAARRARQLQNGAPMLLNTTRSYKPTRIAEEELRHELLEYDMPELEGWETHEENGQKEGKGRKG